MSRRTPPQRFPELVPREALSLGESPSMVVTSAPATVPMAVMHERAGVSFTWTVQAPHRPIPNPNLVPVSLMVSRRTHRSGVSSGTSTSRGRPLSVKVTMARSCYWRKSGGARKVRRRAYRAQGTHGRPRQPYCWHPIASPRVGPHIPLNTQRAERVLQATVCTSPSLSVEQAPVSQHDRPPFPDMS